MEKPRLKYWYEWCTESPLWPTDRKTSDLYGYPVDLSKIGLHEQLIEEIKKTSQWHDTDFNWEFPGAPFLWKQKECDRFTEEITKIHSLIVGDIGDRFEIEFPEPYVEDPELDNYLKDQEEFLERDRRKVEAIKAAYEAYEKGCRDWWKFWKK